MSSLISSACVNSWHFVTKSEIKMHFKSDLKLSWSVRYNDKQKATSLKLDHENVSLRCYKTKSVKQKQLWIMYKGVYRTVSNRIAQ